MSSRKRQRIKIYNNHGNKTKTKLHVLQEKHSHNNPHHNATCSMSNDFSQSESSPALRGTEFVPASTSATQPGLSGAWPVQSCGVQAATCKEWELSDKEEAWCLRLGEQVSSHSILRIVAPPLTLRDTLTIAWLACCVHQLHGTLLRMPGTRNHSGWPLRKHAKAGLSC